jgi:glycosidase
LTKSPHSAKIFANLTSFYLNSYPPQVLDSLWNIIESHDTSRILSSTFGNLDLMKLAVVIQMTFKGSPVIYYGTEIGLDGLKDPYSRKPMVWDEDGQNLDLLNFYKSLIDLRNNSEALKRGDLNILNREGKVLVYSRTLNDQEIIVIVNPSDISENVNINFYGNYNEHFSGEKHSFSKDESLKLAPMEYLILIKQ